MPDPIKFNAKDTRHRGDIPETSIHPRDEKHKQYLRHTPEERKGHAYIKREVARDGTTTYYYGDGVKAIHHPDRKVAGPGYHNRAKEHHQEMSRRALKRGKLKRARAHGMAASGHDFAVSSQGGTPAVKELQKFMKEFAGGTVAVASDPGVFTETFSGRGGKEKKKKHKSGPQKLDMFLERKSLSKITKGNKGAVEKFAIDIIKSASTTLMDNKKGKVEGKTFDGEVRHADVSGYIPPQFTTEDQKNNSPHRAGTETDVKKEATIFDLIQAEIENEAAITELDGMLEKYYKEDESGNADPTEE